LSFFNNLKIPKYSSRNSQWGTFLFVSLFFAVPADEAGVSKEKDIRGWGLEKPPFLNEISNNTAANFIITHTELDPR
jgi:hypothetical protein